MSTPIDSRIVGLGVGAALLVVGHQVVSQSVEQPFDWKPIGGVVVAYSLLLGLSAAGGGAVASGLGVLAFVGLLLFYGPELLQNLSSFYGG